MRALLFCAVSVAAVVEPALPAGAEPNMRPTAPLRGVVRSLHQASFSVDLPLRVHKLNYREAQSFKRGDLIVEFDCRKVEAEYQAAAAASREMDLTWQSQLLLETRGATGKLDVAIAKARADKAEAEAKAIAARLEQCKIRAPFDGRIADLRINENEVPPVGQPFITLVEETNFEIDLILPSSSLRVLAPGTKFEFLVDETQQLLPATIVRVGAAVEPVSQTVKAIGVITRSGAHIIAGMSGTAKIQVLEEMP